MGKGEWRREPWIVFAAACEISLSCALVHAWLTYTHVRQVTDFGFSQKHRIGIAACTPQWMSPEMIMGQGPSMASDGALLPVHVYETCV